MTEHRQSPERETQPPPAAITHPVPDHSEGHERDEQEKTDVNLMYRDTKGEGGVRDKDGNKTKQPSATPAALSGWSQRCSEVRQYNAFTSENQQI